MRFRSCSTILIVLIMLMPSFAFLPWGIFGEEMDSDSRASSRADDDLAVLDITSPDDLDRNVGSMVTDNAIPTGIISVQAAIKNVGDNAQAGPTPVDFTFETGTENIIWSDNMDGGANGWTTSDLTATNDHWHYTTSNIHGGTNSLVANFASGPKSGYYGSLWEEVAEMNNCVNIPASPASEPYFRFWNATNTQSQSDGGRVQMKMGNGQWNDITPYNAFPPPTLSYMGNINSATSIYSNGKGVYTGTQGWFQSEEFPLWQQNVGQVNGTCVYFRFWFSADGSNKPTDYTGWFVDDVTVFTGSSTVPISTDNPGSNTWIFKNLLELGDENGFEQFSGAGVGGTTAWWVGNLTKKSYINGTDHVLISPTIDLTGGGMNEARFTYNQKYNITPLDGGWVEISTNGGTTWNYVEPHFDYSTPASIPTKYPGYIFDESDYGKLGAFTGNSTWEKATFDLTPYIGNNIKIRFHMYSNWDNQNDNGWFIDDLEVKTWNFASHGTGSATLNAVNSGTTVTAQVNYDFDTETDFRIKARVGLVGDTDTGNDEWRAVVRVKNIRDFAITNQGAPTGFTRSVNHGDTLNYWFNVTNTGNLPDDYSLNLSGLPVDWNATLSPTTISNLRPVDGPFLVTLKIETTIDSGPDTYPNLDLQSKDYIFKLDMVSDIDSNVKQEQNFTARVTNTKPTVNFLQENFVGRVYKEFRVSAPITEDPDGDTLEYLIDWGDGSPIENASTWDTPHIYAQSKSASNPYVLTLKVDDGLVESDVTTVNITVTNNPPTAKFIIETIAISNTYAVDEPISFNATAPEYSGDENPLGLTFMWKFGDGNTDEGATVTNTYSTGGDKAVNLTVLDEEDAVGYAEKIIQINSPPTAVISTPTNLQEFFLEDDIEFNASQSSDNEQFLHELDFLWESNIAGELGNQMIFKKSFTSDDDIGNHQITLTVFDRKAKGISYDVRNIMIKARPQNAPSLERDVDNDPVFPAGGFVQTTSFKFSVLYKDMDSDRPRFVKVIIDKGQPEEKSYDMTQADAADRDYMAGVLFTVNVPGNGIGADRLHKFFFEAADERNETLIVKSSEFSGPRITREKLVQNGAADGIRAGVAFAKVRYVGKQDNDPVKLTASKEHATGAPSGTIPLGLFVDFSALIDNNMWDWANLSFKYGSEDFREVREKMNSSSIHLYKLTGGSWAIAEGAVNDENGLIISMNDVKEGGVYGIFGEEKGPDECTGDECKRDVVRGPLEEYLGLIIVIIVIIVFATVLAVMFRKKKKAEKAWGGEEGIDLKIDIISGTGTDADGVTPAADAGQVEDIDTTAGGEVSVYTPATSAVEESAEEGPEVPVYRPGGAAAVVSEEGDIEEDAGPPVWQPGGADESQTWSPEAADEVPAPEVEEPEPEAQAEEKIEEQPEEQPEEPAEETKPEEKKEEGEQDLLDEILGED